MFCFNCTATTESYTYGHTLSLHDALPIFKVRGQVRRRGLCQGHLLGCVHRARLAPAVNDRVPPGGGLESLPPDVKQCQRPRLDRLWQASRRSRSLTHGGSSLEKIGRSSCRERGWRYMSI